MSKDFVLRNKVTKEYYEYDGDIANKGKATIFNKDKYVDYVFDNIKDRRLKDYEKVGIHDLHSKLQIAISSGNVIQNRPIRDKLVIERIDDEWVISDGEQWVSKCISFNNDTIVIKTFHDDKWN